MRILLTVHQFLPESSAGTELIAYYLACELRRRGHDVRIVTTKPCPPDAQPHMDEYAYDGLPVHRFHHQYVRREDQAHEFQSEYDHRMVYHWFKELLRTHRIDLVHVVHLMRLSTAPIDACLDAGIACVFTATDYWAICPMSQLRLPDGAMCRGPNPHSSNCLWHLLKLHREKTHSRMAWAASGLPQWAIGCGIGMLRRGWFAGSYSAAGARAVMARAAHVRERLSRVQRILVPSRTMGELLVANGLPAERVAYLPYGIPVELLPRSTDRGRAGAMQPLRVVFVGQLAEHKGTHVLLQAFRRLPRDVPLQVTVHGDGAARPGYTPRLRKLAGDDPRITFAGGFGHPQIGGILRQADVLVCPSLWYENTPLVIYEALAAGVPVVASRMPGIAEAIKPEVNGLLFEMGDAAALAAILQRLVRDRPLVARLAQHTEMPLSVALHVDRLEEHYSAALEAAAPANKPT